MQDKANLRVWDFWTAIILIVVSLFFIWKTSLIPFFDVNAAGVSGAWYNSAALIPYGVFISLLLLAVGLLIVAIRDGGATRALQSIGIVKETEEWHRVGYISGILGLYIFALVPRVDFVLASALVISALIFGFHHGVRRDMIRSFIFVAIPGFYALLMHPTRAEWNKPHDDDWLTLAAFLCLCVVSIVIAKRQQRINRVIKITPVVSVIAPLMLVMAMAFGFRQNVPNRTGLLFSKIEYHYYVDVLPMLRGS